MHNPSIDIHQLGLGDYKKMLWKNGKGYTYQIARQDNPQGDDFVWRISMADVTEDGEFSYFHDKKRLLSVLSGQGLTLDIDGKIQQLPYQKVCAFDGDSHVYSRLMADSVRDLNLIYDANKLNGEMFWLDELEEDFALPKTDLIFIFNADAKIELMLKDGDITKNYTLEQYDSLKLNHISQTIFLQKQQLNHPLAVIILNDLQN
ncbi:HutD family protein [Acinetobacter sp. c2-A9]